MLNEDSGGEGKRNPVLVFIAEVLVASAIFIVVLIPAVLLNLLVHQLEDIGVDGFILGVVTALEYFIFVVDSALCAFYIIKSAIKVGRSI